MVLWYSLLKVIFIYIVLYSLAHHLCPLTLQLFISNILRMDPIQYLAQRVEPGGGLQMF